MELCHTRKKFSLSYFFTSFFSKPANTAIVRWESCSYSDKSGLCLCVWWWWCFLWRGPGAPFSCHLYCYCVESSQWTEEGLGHVLMIMSFPKWKSGVQFTKGLIQVQLIQTSAIYFRYIWFQNFTIPLMVAHLFQISAEWVPHKQSCGCTTIYGVCDLILATERRFNCISKCACERDGVNESWAYCRREWLWNVSVD